MSTVKKQPFKGLKVLELASVLAGPSVGMFFAELGANVLKVESPQGGDVTRSWKLASESENTHTPAYFCSVNWGKDYLKSDLRIDENRQYIYSLLPETDILIVSYKPGDALKLGMDYDTVKSYNKGLIYGEISGYGSVDKRVGYDAIIQAESGFTFMNGEPEGQPVKMPVAFMDILAAHQLKEGLLTALYHRLQTGMGDYVQVSLLGAALSALANQASNYLMTGHIPERIGSAHPNIAPYGTLYYSSDAKPMVPAIGTDRQFFAFAEILGHPEWALDARFRTNQLRVQNRTELDVLLTKTIQNFTRAELLDLCNQANIPIGAVNNLEEVFKLPLAQNYILRSGDKAGLRTVAFSARNFGVAEYLAEPGGV